MLTPPASQLSRSSQQKDSSGHRFGREGDRSDDRYRQNSHNGHQHDTVSPTKYLSHHDLSHPRNRSSSPYREPRKNQRSSIFEDESPVHDDFRKGPGVRGRSRGSNRYNDAQRNSSHEPADRRSNRKYSRIDRYRPEESPSHRRRVRR